MATKRRGKGEGSISFRKKEKRWVAAINLPDGSRRVRYGKTRTEAVDALRALERERTEGVFNRNHQMTVNGLFDLWLKDVVSIGRRKSTQDDYRYALDRLRKSLGTIKLVNLTPQQVQSAISKLTQERSATTVRKTSLILKMVLRRAVRWGMIARSPADEVEVPDAEAEERAVLENEDIHAVLNAISGHRLYALFLTLAHTGMRKGEALALTWNDIGADTIRIRHTLRRDGTLGPPKSRSSVRAIEVPALVIAELRRHETRQKEERIKTMGWRNDADLVFTNCRGRPVALAEPNHILSVNLAGTGLAHVTPHDFRHALATLLMASGTYPNKVQRYLGHANVSITMSIYGHVTPGMRGEVAGDIERVMRRPEKAAEKA